ncbi:S-methyl-5-thioribose-1-phosphate isomerase [Lujinxingia litoralis]|uniref:S-methyl-5-thioribose-1-phosphate isomerase n=1 Tax=Lujinxingia litoralis TaxID=2211119 RepID=UPI003D3177B9
MASNVVPLKWEGDRASGTLRMLDQRRLPTEEYWQTLHSAEEVARGIRDMVIRGAPAIGIAAAFGMALGMRAFDGEHTSRALELRRLHDLLASTRPTAVNLFWALERCRQVAERLEDADNAALTDALFDEAERIFQDDRDNNLRLGNFGAALFEGPTRILTHCNTGALATGGYGTALGVIRALHAQGKLTHVWVDETRPYLQGARLTAWECVQEGIDATLITDSMAAHFMKLGQVDAVIVGTDRIARNGDVANKIGTYMLAVLCKHHNIPFYVATPLSTIDLSTASGDDIEIEQRDPAEVSHIGERQMAPEGVGVAHPAFDVTPANLVTAIITEAGVVHPPYTRSLPTLF